LKAEDAARVGPGLPPRAMYQDCQGATVEMHGTPLASQASDTGLVVSGVDCTSIRLTLLFRIRSLATVDAMASVDWLSLTRIWTLCFFPATVMPCMAK
jgi:hypothetical protein